MKCWICGGTEFEAWKDSDIDSLLTSSNFAITDSHYGKTGTIERCRNCGFLQCTDIRNVTAFYEELEDRKYDEGKEERGLQARRLLELVRRHKNTGRLLDVGAGSGILVEQAIALGYDAEGVEPSNWLQQQAQLHSLSVHRGVLPHPDISGQFDVVTIVDVIEHVDDPVWLLESVGQVMTDDGIGLVVTPDVASVTARLLGKRWWHFRIAHIGYFSMRNLQMALDRAGFRAVQTGRPTWYFSLNYLLSRASAYLPGSLRFPQWKIFNRVTVPLNLFDSMYVVFAKKSMPGN